MVAAMASINVLFSLRNKTKYSEYPAFLFAMTRFKSSSSSDKTYFCENARKADKALS